VIEPILGRKLPVLLSSRMFRLSRGIVSKSKFFLSTEVSVEDKIRVGEIIDVNCTYTQINVYVQIDIDTDVLYIIPINLIIFRHHYRFQSILKLEFEPTFAEVKDVSGGCGAMFDISVESHKFKVNDTVIYLL
jgi:hypothetical protein